MPLHVFLIRNEINILFSSSLTMEISDFVRFISLIVYCIKVSFNAQVIKVFSIKRRFKNFTGTKRFHPNNVVALFHKVKFSAPDAFN